MLLKSFSLKHLREYTKPRGPIIDKGGWEVRILFATTLKHLPQAVGGSQRLTDELCKGLATTGLTCAVLASLGANGLLGLRTRAVARMVSWPRVPADRSAGYPVYRRWTPASAISEIIARFRPSIAVVMSGAPKHLIESFLAAGVPTIQFILDALPETLEWQPELQAGIAFIACSRFLATRARSLLGIEPIVVPPIVDAEEYRVDTDRSSVIFVNPVPQKGVEIALRLAEERPDIRFEFVECWELNRSHTHYREKAKSLANITRHPPMLDIRQIYRRGRLILAPSQWEEAWCRVVTEAQASGIPALASRRGGLPEAVGPGGILVEPDADISVWKAALSRLWDDHAAYARFGEAALSHSRRQEIASEHVLSQFRDCLMRHYQEFASKKRAPPGAAAQLRPMEGKG